MKLVAAVILALSVAMGAGAQPADNTTDISGTWLGTLKVGSMSLRIVFDVKKTQSGLSATMDSLDQGVRGLPVASIRVDGNLVVFDVKVASASYVGTLSGDRKSMSGSWIQGGKDFPLDMQLQSASTAQAPAAADPARPQEPFPPYPYTMVDMKIWSGAAGAELAGTLVVPQGQGPFPAALLVTGSGPQDRNETILGHKPFLVIADYLARRGIATLRCDDRGVGQSGGNFQGATTFDFAADADSALQALKGRPEIDPARVGVIGHSEGGLIASILGAWDQSLAFLVLLAGPGVRGDQLLLMQNEALARAAGAPEAYIKATSALNRALYGIALSDADAATAAREIADRLKASRDLFGPGGEAVYNEMVSQADNLAAQLLAPWTRVFISIDPADFLSMVSVPVLALNGSKDLQVPAKENLAAIGSALDGAGNTVYALKELDGLNHLFQHANTGLPSEYGDIQETFAPEALEALSAWLSSLPPRNP